MGSWFPSIMSTTGTSSPSMVMVISATLSGPLGLWSSAFGTALPNMLLAYSSYWLGGYYPLGGLLVGGGRNCPGGGAHRGFGGGVAGGVGLFGLVDRRRRRNFTRRL